MRKLQAMYKQTASKAKGLVTVGGKGKGGVGGAGGGGRRRGRGGRGRRGREPTPLPSPLPQDRDGDEDEDEDDDEDEDEDEDEEEQQQELQEEEAEDDEDEGDEDGEDEGEEAGGTASGSTEAGPSSGQPVVYLRGSSHLLKRGMPNEILLVIRPSGEWFHHCVRWLPQSPAQWHSGDFVQAPLSWHCSTCQKNGASLHVCALYLCPCHRGSQGKVFDNKAVRVCTELWVSLCINQHCSIHHIHCTFFK